MGVGENGPGPRYYIRPMMAADLAVSLSAVETALRRLDRNTLLGRLRQGLSNEIVRSGLASAGLLATPEFERLYAWRDGTSIAGATLDDIHLFPGFYLLSLEDALLHYRDYVACERWRRGWIPIFANGGGDFYVVVLTRDGNGSIRHSWIEETDHPVEFSSLKSMFNTLAQGFARDVFFVDNSSGYLEMDDNVFFELAKELNADVGYWRELV